MAGILSAQDQPNQAQPEKRDPQEAFDKFVANALNILHESKVSDPMIQRIKSSEDTAEAVGDAALDIVKRLEASAQENGYPLTANTIINGMNVVVGELINICEAAGANKFSEEQKYQAFSWAIGKYLDEAVKSGKITQEDLVRVTQMIEQQGGGQKEEIPGGESPSERQMPMQGGM